MKPSILTSIDIGTHSVKILMGKKEHNKKNFEILAMVKTRSMGVRRGEVIKVNKIAPIIESSIVEIEKQSGIRIRDHVYSINGSHLSVVNSQGLVSVSRADQKISQEDIDRVIRQAESVNLSSNREALELFVKEFIIDGAQDIKEPLGLHGRRLELKALLTCVFSPVKENLFKAFSSAGLDVDEKNIVPCPIASAEICLSYEQKELGVALVDIGAETTGLAVFEDGNLIHCHVVPLGSANITNDIALGLRTEIETAERIKKEFGSLSSKNKKKNTKTKNEKIRIPEKSLVCSKKVLENIIEARVSEIFSHIQKELKKISKQEILPAGVVLTGGGSLLPGIKEYSKQALKLPCRTYIPKNIPGLPEDPAFSTALGLLSYAWKEEKNIENGSGVFSKMSESIKKIIKLLLPS
jgi:cell division protein FtsA